MTKWIAAALIAVLSAAQMGPTRAQGLIQEIDALQSAVAALTEGRETQAESLALLMAAQMTLLTAQNTDLMQRMQALEADNARLRACAPRMDELTFVLNHNTTSDPMSHDLGTVPDAATIWFSNHPNGPWWLMDGVYSGGGYGTWLTDATAETVRFSAGPESASSSYGARSHWTFFGGTGNSETRYFRVILTARPADPQCR